MYKADILKKNRIDIWQIGHGTKIKETLVFIANSKIKALFMNVIGVLP